MQVKGANPLSVQDFRAGIAGISAEYTKLWAHLKTARKTHFFG